MQRGFAIGGKAKLVHTPALHLRYYMPVENIVDVFALCTSAQTIAAGAIATVKYIQIDKFGTMAGEGTARQPVGEPQVVANVGKLHDD